MKIFEETKWVFVPSLFAIGMGLLAIKSPNAMTNIEPPYHASSWEAALFLFVLLLTCKILWGTVGGIVAIVFGSLGLVVCLLLNSEQSTHSLLIEKKEK